MAKQKKDKEVNALLDRLLEGKSPEEIVGGGGLLEDLTTRLLERALEGELTDHLGYEKHATEGRNGGNSRNGRTAKRVKTDTAELEIDSGTATAASRRSWSRRANAGCRASTRR